MMKLYEVPFTLQIYVSGVVRYVRTSVHIAATSEDEAREKIRSQMRIELSQIHKPIEIDYKS